MMLHILYIILCYITVCLNRLRQLHCQVVEMMVLTCFNRNNYPRITQENNLPSGYLT